MSRAIMKEEDKPPSKQNTKLVQNDKGQTPADQNNHRLPTSVGIIYSEVKKEYFPTENQYITEKDAYRDSKIIAKYLERMGIKTKLYPANQQLSEKLHHDKPDMVLNLVGSVRGQEYLAATIPGLLELLDISYTGVGILGGALDYNKFLVKKLLQQNGIPVPNYQLFNTSLDQIDPTLRFPLISKLNEIHGAVEINKDAVSETEKHLRQRINYLIKTYNQPVLVEEFIVGREITAILLEGLKKKIYLAEKIFANQNAKYIFATFEDQWLKSTTGGYNYRKYNDPLLREYVKKAFEVMRMADYAKFDIRLDTSGRYYFLDSNTNPAFGPEELDCAISTILRLHGITFVEILRRLLINTMLSANSTHNSS